ncbi:MAG: endo alpha-1,4 polygalactosaminidase, partial [Polyangiaceae bacterium]
EWIANTVHGLGMAVFQKNDLDQVAALEPFFDGILDEECSKYGECSSLAPYTKAKKPAWDAEYQDEGESTGSFCAADVKAGIAGALFELALDGKLFEPCPNDVGIVN